MTTFDREPNTVHVRREKAKVWTFVEINAEDEEDGEGSIEQEPRGFHWYIERWIPDGKGSANRKFAEGVTTTWPQARDRILAFLKVPLSRLRYLKAHVSQNVLVDVSDVEPKAPKAKLTAIKKTSKAARARTGGKSAASAWAKIRAFVMPAKKKTTKKKGRVRR